MVTFEDWEGASPLVDHFSLFRDTGLVLPDIKVFVFVGTSESALSHDDVVVMSEFDG